MVTRVEKIVIDYASCGSSIKPAVNASDAMKGGRSRVLRPAQGARSRTTHGWFVVSARPPSAEKSRHATLACEDLVKLRLGNEGWRMRRLTRVVTCSLAAGVGVFGCSNEPEVVKPTTSSGASNATTGGGGNAAGGGGSTGTTVGG